MPAFDDFDLDEDVKEPAPEPTVVKDSSDVELQFDPDYVTDSKEIHVSVAGLAPRKVSTDGKSFKVPAAEAELLIQSPAIKAVN